LRVAVVRLPRASNITDVEALAAEPGVDVLVTTDPQVVREADLVVLPGSRTTSSDLTWLRACGLADALVDRAGRELPVLGICGGHQMLAATICDDVEGDAGEIDGLGLLPTRVIFHTDKTLGRPVGGWRGHSVSAYEIHHGLAWLASEHAAEPFLDGWRVAQAWNNVARHP
jgi:adenosylcobyric acid synthase